MTPKQARASNDMIEKRGFAVQWLGVSEVRVHLKSVGLVHIAARKIENIAGMQYKFHHTALPVLCFLRQLL